MTGDEGDCTPKSGSSGSEISLEVIPLHATNLLTVLDENGIIRYESPSIERIYGYTQDELVGEHVAEYFHPDDRQRVLDGFQTIVTSEEYTVEAVEYRHEQADGSYRWVESTASSDATPDERYVINTRDISDRKEREDELTRKNERLAKFTNVVGHDLRNPLQVAKIELASAMDECDSEHLVGIERAHERMESLIDDLLTLALAGNRIEETELVSLAVVSASAWENVATATATLQIDTDCHVRADTSRLQQLLENLFRNAVEHGGEDVTARVGDVSDESGFFVADTGPGIAEDERNQLFESGFSTRQNGTGLGLPIVRDIAEAHGWETAVTESRTGGARFEFANVELY